MEEKGVSGSFMVISEENTDSLYPMILGVSCAFLALRQLPEPDICDEKWSEIRNRMYKGSALVGLLVWTVRRNVATTEKMELVQNLAKAQIEIAELKKRRSEDAKANEKVVCIFAGREQSWFDERRKLRQQIGAVMNDMRVVEAKREKSVSEVGEKMKEIEVILQLKDKMIEEAERRRLEAEKKVKAAENVAEVMRESVKSEVERHSNEISKHKTAFIELVSNQRQLEAEMGRTIRQVEAAKHELEQKEQLVLMNQRLSMELVRMHKDLEQKEHILSAMLRKSKIDTAEKQMLLKEVRSSKAKRKQAELESARWRAVAQSKHDRNSLRNMFSKHVNAKSDAWNHKSFVDDGIEELTDAKQLGNWEAENFEVGVEHKHRVEIDAFMEQLRQKDDKLEAYNWRLMSTELESKRLQSHIEALNCDIVHLRQDNAKLEGILFEREAKLHSMMMHSDSSMPQKLRLDAEIVDDTVWSRVKVVKRKPRQEMKAVAEENDRLDNDIVLTIEPPNKEKDCGSTSTWKMDVHALGVSYKVKRLRQQLFMLQRLTGKKQNCTNTNGEDLDNGRVKGFDALMSLLNKQVDRYQSLQGKIDHLCKRMQENKLNSSSTTARLDDDTKMMEHFLEETFQLQRYIVSTGQKLMEVQTKIASSLVGEAEEIEKPGSFDIERFGESLKTLFRETQRGVEVRISRIIGDLEGTLARDGFNTWRRL
ncbi:hypothetical protein C2S52_015758 [Perilla frutescens var. hirtella]|nr:hypothetical protein C2S52_015758 [Perilla frutescens var. hirtella]